MSIRMVKKSTKKHLLREIWLGMGMPCVLIEMMITADGGNCRWWWLQISINKKKQKQKKVVPLQMVSGTMGMHVDHQLYWQADMDDCKEKRKENLLNTNTRCRQ